MKHHRSLVLTTTVAAGLLLARSAHADANADLQKVADDYMYGVATVESGYPGPEELNKRQPEDCFAALATAKSAGVKDSDLLVGGKDLWRHPKVVKNDQGEYTITVADVPWICSEYKQKWYVEILGAYSRGASSDYLLGVPRFDIKTRYPSEAESYIKSGTECIAIVDRAIAAGIDTSTSLEIDGGKTTLGELKAKICEPLAAAGTKFLAEINTFAKDKADAIVDVYKKAGIKGQRLELFVYYGMPEDGSFLAAGCTKFVTTVKGLKKAKKLFIWLTSNDGTVTIRKYTFKGDKYTTSEKSFYTEAAAYRGCK